MSFISFRVGSGEAPRFSADGIGVADAALSAVLVGGEGRNMPGALLRQCILLLVPTEEGSSPNAQATIRTICALAGYSAPPQTVQYKGKSYAVLVLPLPQTADKEPTDG